MLYFSKMYKKQKNSKGQNPNKVYPLLHLINCSHTISIEIWLEWFQWFKWATHALQSRRLSSEKLRMNGFNNNKTTIKNNPR